MRIAILAFTLALASLPAWAQVDPDESQGQPQCAPKARMLDELRDHFHELPTFMAASGTGKPILLTMSQETGTWTMLFGAISGKVELLCAVASGENATMLDPKKDDGGKDD